jgi:hypothetical protein
MKNQVSVLESVAGIGQLKAYLELVETTLEPQLIAKLQAAMP